MEWNGVDHPRRSLEILEMASQSLIPLTAADLMTANPRTCSSFSSVLEAVLIFRDAECGAVPILDDGKPVGVLTHRDRALALAEHGARLPSPPLGQVMTKGAVSGGPGRAPEKIGGPVGG